MATSAFTYITCC